TYNIYRSFGRRLNLIKTVASYRKDGNASKIAQTLSEKGSIEDAGDDVNSLTELDQFQNCTLQFLSPTRTGQDQEDLIHLIHKICVSDLEHVIAGSNNRPLFHHPESSSRFFLDE